MAKRFIVNDSDLEFQKDGTIYIMGNEANHIKVLRHEVGEAILVNDMEVIITKIEKNKILCEVKGKTEKYGEPKSNITLIQSYLKADKMEYVVQKAVELGVKNIIPAITKNTVVKFDDKSKIKKQERLEKIAIEALGQCGRSDMVNVAGITNIRDIDFTSYDLVLICHERATESLKVVLDTCVKNSINIAVVIGPEGGLEDEDICKMKDNINTHIVTFGERILRAETASLYMLSILSYLEN